MRHRVALAVNPTAGRGRAAHAGTQVAAQLTTAGVDVVDVVGADAVQAAARAATAIADGVDALVVVGGDGLVHLGVNAVAGTPTPLGIVAAGTGNDVARGLGLPLDDPATATCLLLEALREGTVRAVDAVRYRPANGAVRWYAGVLGAGFDALVNERANSWTRPRGHLRYDLAILRELPVLRPRHYELVLDGERWSTPAVLAVVANGPSYGGGMRICPDARWDDGLLDVLVVLPLSRTAFLRIYPRVYAGTHVGDPRVVVRRARRVRIDAPGIVAYADGERLAPLPLTCEVAPGSLRVLSAPSRS